MKTLKLVPLMAFSMVAASCPPHQDTSVYAAFQAGQPSIIFSGGGDGPRRGFLGLEVSEGADPNSSLISVVMPNLNCKRESCATFEVARKDGSVYPLGGIPKGQTQLTFPLSAITGNANSVEAAAGGPYRVLTEAYFEAGGQEYKALARGVIYVSVLRKGYSGVACNGPDVAWAVKVGKECEAQFTTKLRSALCGRGCQ